MQFLKGKYLIVSLLLVMLQWGAAIANMKNNNSAMLAGNWSSSVNIDGWWLSEKLDGVRGCWDGKEMLSKSGRRINVPAWFLRNFPPFALDGELWTGRGDFSNIISIVSKDTPGPEWHKIKYYIFDVPHKEDVFEKRMKKAEEWFRDNPSLYAAILEQKICGNNTHLAEELKKVEKLNGEGIMLRRPGSLYSTGRSRDILKVKTFHDAEAVVVSHIKGNGRNSMRMGSMRVRLPDGKEFLIGTGFTDQERDNPPPIGSLITFKYKEINKSGIPRFASFLRIREKL